MIDETPFNPTTNPEQPGISIIRPDATIQTRQQLPYFVVLYDPILDEQTLE